VVAHGMRRPSRLSSAGLQVVAHGMRRPSRLSSAGLRCGTLQVVLDAAPATHARLKPAAWRNEVALQRWKSRES
jgi:hypothetical protein